MILIYLLIGIGIGIFATKKLPKIINNLRTKKNNYYRITLHGYFPIHEVGNAKNSFAETQSVTIVVTSESEKKAEDFITQMIMEEFRIEIENIEEIENN
jgi:hypothetical protein